MSKNGGNTAGVSRRKIVKSQKSGQEDPAGMMGEEDSDVWHDKDTLYAVRKGLKPASSKPLHIEK
jgi:hypothetical protein